MKTILIVGLAIASVMALTGPANAVQNAACFSYEGQQLPCAWMYADARVYPPGDEVYLGLCYNVSNTGIVDDTGMVCLVQPNTPMQPCNAYVCNPLPISEIPWGGGPNQDCYFSGYEGGGLSGYYLVCMPALRNLPVPEPLPNDVHLPPPSLPSLP